MLFIKGGRCVSSDFQTIFINRRTVYSILERMRFVFNVGLKKEALKIHEQTLQRYNSSYKRMGESCENLYRIRGESVSFIKFVQRVINSIANTPKEFETELGKIGKELIKFSETEEYAQEAFHASVKAGVNIVGGGREIGEKLATRLGIDFYDKELIRLASEESGLCCDTVCCGTCGVVVYF